MKKSSLLMMLFASLMTLPVARGAEMQVEVRSEIGDKRISGVEAAYHRGPVRVRTLKRIPKGTRAVVYRTVRYYPVQGMFYVSRKGIYQRTFPPVGFRVRNLSVRPTRIVVKGKRYYYSFGIFYQKKGSDYLVVKTHMGEVVRKLPKDTAKITWEGSVAHQLNGVVYRKVKGGYQVIAQI
jgi:hypothetical protein